MALLKEGDVFEIEPNDKFYADIPRHFAYGQSGNWRLTHHEVGVKLRHWSDMFIGREMFIQMAITSGL